MSYQKKLLNTKFAAPRVVQRKIDQKSSLEVKPIDLSTAEEMVKNIMTQSNAVKKCSQLENDLLEVINDLKKPRKVLDFSKTAYEFDVDGIFLEKPKVIISERLKQKEKDDQIIDGVIKLLQERDNTDVAVNKEDKKAGLNLKTKKKVFIDPKLFISSFGTSDSVVNKNFQPQKDSANLFKESSLKQSSQVIEPAKSKGIDVILSSSIVKEAEPVLNTKKADLNTIREKLQDSTDYNDLDHQDIGYVAHEYSTVIHEDSDSDDEPLAKQREDFKNEEAYEMYKEAQKFKSDINVQFYKETGKGKNRSREKHDFSKVKDIMKRKFGTDLGSNKKAKQDE